MTAFKIWFASKKAARDLVVGISTGKFDLDDMSGFLANMEAAS